MPLTEAPNSADRSPDQAPEPEAQSPAQPPSPSKTPLLGLGLAAAHGPDKAKSSRYTSLGQHELITLVEDLEDERSRARVREGIWISVIVHLLLFWYLAYGPQVLFHRPRVINPSDVLAKRDARFLDLPPDALQHIKPKPTNIISDKDRVAQSAHPTLDKKTLEQLEAMKAAGPPEPAPQPTPQQQAQANPQPPAPQQGQQSKQPQTQPLAPQPQAALDMPKPAPTTPNFKMGGGSVSDQIRSAAQNAARGGPVGGSSGLGAPSRHPGNVGGMEILSDTMGVDFGPYMQRLKYLIEHTWWPIIPEEAMPPLSKKGVTVIRFKIAADGTLEDMVLEGKSGTVSLDRAAWGALTGSKPLPPLPKDFKGPYLEIRGGFLYNLTPDDLK